MTKREVLIARLILTLMIFLCQDEELNRELKTIRVHINVHGEAS